MTDEYYDPEDLVPRSPGLKPIPILYSKQPEPNHTSHTANGHSRSSSDTSSSELNLNGDTKKKKKRTAAKPTQGDFVLISHLDPNRLDIASVARERLLEGDTDEDERSSLGEIENRNGTTNHVILETKRAKADNASSDVEMESPTIMALPPILEPKSVLMTGRIPGDLTIPRASPRSSKRLNKIPALQPSPDIISRKIGRPKVKRDLEDPMKTNGLPPNDVPHASRIDAADTLVQLAGQSPPRRSSDSRKCLASSPKLQPHMVPPASIPPLQRLHSIHDIPKEVAEQNGSPNLSLPPVGPLIEEAHSVEREIQAIHPRGRTTSTASYNSIGGLSPTSLAKPFKGGRSPGQFSRTSGDTPSSVRSQSIRSPPNSHNSYPPGLPYATSSGSSGSPSIHISVSGSEDYSSGTHPTPSDIQASIEGESPDGQRPLSSGTTQYKCPVADCTALPFATQYLLNSHMNVHSEVRQHFCPVKGCNRGPGGTGFKRKNEMIRHRLVHESPGYVCPYCPDRDHRYPRPDNLLRHVRMHHEGKSKDDPALREVLNRRPNGTAHQSRRRRNMS